MDTIRIAVQAYMLDLYPQNRGRQSQQQPQQPPPSGQHLRSLANGLALPSFWSPTEINEAFALANRIWDQAKIEFTPVSISSRSESVPADENGMWIHFINRLSPRSGIAVAFVFDLPSNEGGWGGGRIAAVAGAKAIGALAGYQGRILAHELGHILLNTPNHETSSSNLMFGQRHPRVATADLLEPGQITDARTRAQML
jgi:hypothetical protein